MEGETVCHVDGRRCEPYYQGHKKCLGKDCKDVHGEKETKQAKITEDYDG